MTILKIKTKIADRELSEKELENIYIKGIELSRKFLDIINRETIYELSVETSLIILLCNIISNHKENDYKKRIYEKIEEYLKVLDDVPQMVNVLVEFPCGTKQVTTALRNKGTLEFMIDKHHFTDARVISWMALPSPDDFIVN